MEWVAIDVHIAGNTVTHRLAETFRLRVPEAAGLLVLIYAGMAEHAPDGSLASATNSQIESWAHWHGKRGQLAQFVRAELCDEAGMVTEWEQWNGANMRAAEASRKRSKAWRDERRKEKEERNHVTPETPNRTPKRTPLATRTELVANATTGQDKTKELLERDLLSGAGNTPAPLRLCDLPPAAVAFIGAFYPPETSPPARRAEIAQQLVDTLTVGARLSRREGRVFAYSLERLEAKCAEVVANPPSKRDSAIVVLLKKLGDTSDGSAPGHVAEHAAQADRHAEEQATAHRVALAEAWLATQNGAALELEAALDATSGLDPDPRNPIRRILRRTELLRRWHEAGEP